MIVASSYPLSSMVQRWDPPEMGDRRRQLFSSQDNQGTYNATLTLLLPGGETELKCEPGPAASSPNDVSGSKLYDALFDYGPPFDKLKYLGLFWDETTVARKDGSKCAVRRWDELSSWELPLEDYECPPVWVSVVGQRGVWPLFFEHLESEPDKQVLSEAQQYVSRVRYQKALHSADFVAVFTALIPQFTWQWGAVFLGTAGVCWLIILGNVGSVLAAVAGKKQSGAADRFFCIPERGGSNRVVAVSREVYVFVGWVLLGFALVYVMIPCWIAAWCSPWAIFSRSDLYSYLGERDRWNWRFTAVALSLGLLTLSAIPACALARVAAYPCWNWPQLGRSSRDFIRRLFRRGSSRSAVLLVILPLFAYGFLIVLAVVATAIVVRALWPIFRRAVQQLWRVRFWRRMTCLLIFSGATGLFIGIALWEVPWLCCEHVLRTGRPAVEYWRRIDRVRRGPAAARFRAARQPRQRGVSDGAHLVSGRDHWPVSRRATDSGLLRRSILGRN